MLKNNNRAVVFRMAGRACKNRGSVVMAVSVAISAFLLFCLLAVGAVYFQLEKTYNVRMNGSENDAILYGVTDAQMRLCESHPDIRGTGICALAGYIEQTDKDQTVDAALLWADKNYWDKMSAPARIWMEGTYPQTYDEVLMTQKAMEECGQESLAVGDSFTMTYHTPNGTATGRFRISGIWGGYSNPKDVYVSEAFYKQSGCKLSDHASGRYLIDFAQTYVSGRKRREFTDSLQLSKKQMLVFTTNYDMLARIIIGASCLAFAVCLCAYLIVSNIMYLTVSGRVRYYGLLQTIGMTGRQLCAMIWVQMAYIGTVGTAIGIGAGSGVSCFLIPYATRALGQGVEHAGDFAAVCRPVYFLLPLVLMGATLFAAGRKPLQIAARLTPVEALGYRPRAGRVRRAAGIHWRQPANDCGPRAGRVRRAESRRRKLALRMAWTQLVKDRKKSVRMILSLSTVLTVFLCVATFIQDETRANTDTFMDFDLIITNDTLRAKDIEKHGQPLEQVMLDQIREIPGVREVHSHKAVDITVPWQPGVADRWMEEMYAVWAEEPYETIGREDYKQHPKKYPSMMVGIDETEFARLNETFPEPVDAKRFQNGELCILYQDGTGFTDRELVGQRIACREYAHGRNEASFEIVGVTDAYEFASMPSYPPLLIVSSQAVEAFTKEPLVAKAGVYYKKPFDRQTEQAVLAVLEKSKGRRDVSYDSKCVIMDAVLQAQGPLRSVGAGITAVLALICLLNYVNTTIGNIQSRMAEFSVMESIGMSGRQLTRLLALEGFLYAGGSLFVTLTAGAGAAYALHRIISYYGMGFLLPVAPLLCAAAAAGIVCMAVPPFVYYLSGRKKSLVERMQKFE